MPQLKKGVRRLIEKRVKESALYQEMKDTVVNVDGYFAITSKKFLQNIDTFYYSITIKDNHQNSNENYLKLLEVLKIHNEIIIDEPVQVFELDPMFYMNGISVGQYKYDLEVLDECLYLFANRKMNDDTPEIIVQIRSYMLWSFGIKKAYEISLSYIKKVLDKYEIEIDQVKENRIDYCWHTNYIQNPKRFFKIENIAKMRVGRLKEYDLHGIFKGEYDFETDYLRLGRLKSNNILFRTYLKSKEVVEMGYKSWFLKIWLLNKMINRYDFYCLEEAYKNGRWSYLNKARLKFYLENVKDIPIGLRKRIEDCIDHETDHDVVSELAAALTPTVTIVINVEYATKRKFYHTIDKVNFKNRQGFDREVQVSIDNIPVFIQYLTHDSLRFVNPETATWKKDAEYNNFWNRLRNAKINGSPTLPKDIKLIRIYKNEVNIENIKQDALKKMGMYSVLNGKLNDDFEEDSMELVNNLNDNDIYNYKRYIKKKIHQQKIDESQLKQSDHNLITIDLNNNQIITKNKDNINTLNMLKNLIQEIENREKSD